MAVIPEAKLPDHLSAPAYVAPPKPADGESFAKADSFWIDPVTQDRYIANGWGYFEGFNGLGLSEFPGHALVPEDDYFRELEQERPWGIKEFQALAADVQAMGPLPTAACNHFQCGAVWKELKQRGVQIDTEVQRNEEDPEDYGKSVVTALSGYTQKIDEDVRRHFTELAATLRDRPKTKKRGEAMTKKEDQGTTINVQDAVIDVVSAWEQLHARAAAAGLPDNVAEDLLDRVCRDMNVPLGLTAATLPELEKALDQEIVVATRQDQPAPEESEQPDAGDVDESTQETIAEMVEDALAEESEAETEGDSTDSTDSAPKDSKPKKSRKKREPEPIFALEGKRVTNCFSGEVKDAGTIEERMALLLLREANLEKLLKQVRDDIKGLVNCYKLGFLDLLKPEFRRLIKPDGSWRRKSITGEYLIYKPKTTGGIVQLDKDATADWLNGMDEGTAALYGGAVTQEWKLDKNKVAALLKDGVEVPGFVEMDEDEIGDLAISLNPKAGDTAGTSEEQAA